MTIQETAAGPGPVSDTNPPETTITGSKAKKRKATFEFTSSEAGSSFECKLDDGPFESCLSPRTYTKLKKGTHSFQVRAKDQAGNVDPTPAAQTFKVKKKKKK